ALPGRGLRGRRRRRLDRARTRALPGPLRCRRHPGRRVAGRQGRRERRRTRRRAGQRGRPLGRGGRRRGGPRTRVTPWGEGAYAVLVSVALARGDRGAARRTLDRALAALAELDVEP